MLNQPKFNLGPTDPGPNPLLSLLEDIKKSLTGAKEILIIIRDNPRVDHVASALSLYLSLKDAGKSVFIACATEMRVEFNRLVGVDKISAQIGNRNLVISFPYVKDSIEKVSYNVDEANFNLVIQPKVGFPSLDSTKVQYSYSGASADLVFIVGAQKLEDLGTFYLNERKLFEQATLINLDASPVNTRFAPLNLVWAEYVSCAEMVTDLLSQLGLKLTEDIATNLLAGLNEATQNFQRFNIKAGTFEMAARLMKAGGKRPLASPAFGPNFSSSASPFGPMSPFSFPSRPTPAAQPTAPVAPQSVFVEPTLASLNQPSTLSQPLVTPTSPTPPTPSQNDAAPSPADDWLKPKILTGSSKI